MRVLEIATADGRGYYLPLEPCDGVLPCQPNFPDAAAVRLCDISRETFLSLEQHPDAPARFLAVTP